MYIRKIILSKKQKEILVIGFVLITTILFMVLTANPVLCATLWDQAESAGNEMTTSFTTLYEGLFWPVFLVTAAFWLFTKEPKARGIWKCVCLGSIGLLFLLEVKDMVIDTVKGFAGFFGASVS